jgi:hypothetical protein
MNGGEIGGGGRWQRDIERFAEGAPLGGFMSDFLDMYWTAPAQF